MHVHACVHGQMHSMSAHITTSHAAEADLLAHWCDGLAIATGNNRPTQFLNTEQPSVVIATCVQAHPLQSLYLLENALTAKEEDFPCLWTAGMLPQLF